MGLFGRLKGARSQGPTSLPTAPSRVTLPGGRGYGVDVVGESFHQEHLERVGRGRTEFGVRNENVLASLVPEPANPYDPNAVAVHVEGGVVGHLGREDAVGLRPVIDQAIQSYGGATCEARLTGGWDRGGEDQGYIGVVLHIESPHQRDLAERRYVPPPTADEDRIVPDEREIATVTVTCEEHYQHALMAMFPGGVLQGWRSVVVELVDGFNPHKSGTALEARLQGSCAGYLTQAMSERYRSLLSRSELRTTCVGEVHPGAKGGETIARLRLMLPRT